MSVVGCKLAPQARQTSIVLNHAGFAAANDHKSKVRLCEGFYRDFGKLAHIVAAIRTPANAPQDEAPL